MLQKDLHHLQQWKEDHCHEVKPKKMGGTAGNK